MSTTQTKRNDFSKKDMNFLSEFSSSNTQVASLIPVFLLVVVIAIAVVVGITAVIKIQEATKTKATKELRDEMNSEEYQEKLSSYDSTTMVVADLRSYHFVLSELDARVKALTVVNPATLNAVVEQLPADTILTGYEEKDGKVIIRGTSLESYSPMNYLETLQSKGIFEFISITEIKPFTPTENSYTPEIMMAVDDYYTFEFVGTLKGSYSVSYSQYIEGETPTSISSVSASVLASGDAYTIPTPLNISYEGANYTLSSITINGVVVNADILAEAKRDEQITGMVDSAKEVKIFYTQSTTEGSEG